MGLKTAVRTGERSPKMEEGMGKKDGSGTWGVPGSLQAAPAQSHSKPSTEPQLKKSLSFLYDNYSYYNWPMK